MTLKVDATSIKINNNSGVLKFSSNDKLVYLKNFITGTIDVGAAVVTVPFVSMGSNDFLYLTIKFNASNGNTVSELLGKYVPANGSIVTNFYGRGVNNTPAADTDLLCADIAGSDLRFTGYKIDYNVTLQATTVTSNLTYRAGIYSYL
jgi:hypothetical protein